VTLYQRIYLYGMAFVWMLSLVWPELVFTNTTVLVFIAASAYFVVELFVQFLRALARRFLGMVP
jgi:hypothetical protein